MNKMWVITLTSFSYMEISFSIISSRQIEIIKTINYNNKIIRIILYSQTSTLMPLFYSNYIERKASKYWLENFELLDRAKSLIFDTHLSRVNIGNKHNYTIMSNYEFLELWGLIRRTWRYFNIADIRNIHHISKYKVYLNEIEYRQYKSFFESDKLDSVQKYLNKNISYVECNIAKMYLWVISQYTFCDCKKYMQKKIKEANKEKPYYWISWDAINTTLSTYKNVGMYINEQWLISL